MLAQQSQTNTTPSSPPSKVHAIRRAHSTPRLINTIRTYRSTSPADTSALIPSHLATTDTSSSGDEFVWVKPKGRAQFECNICFDAAREPVVTQCGHLYCWPCLHQVLSTCL